jgi:cupin 2 domain-containing protein
MGENGRDGTGSGDGTGGGDANAARSVGAPRYGRPRAGSTSPARGETVFEVVSGGGLDIRQVLSGDLGGPVDYLQPDDEWALVVTGSARLAIGEVVVELGPGDWAWLPAGTPHRLLSTEPGTSWVTVHHDKAGRHV